MLFVNVIDYEMKGVLHANLPIDFMHYAMYYDIKCNDLLFPLKMYI